MVASLSRRKLLAAGGGAAAAAATLSAPAIAQGLKKWRMVTSWPRGLPGPGVSADRLARRIGEMSGGRLTVDVYAAGEIVPALEVFDAVAGGSAEMAHTASFFWQGKVPAAVFFTTVPFGLTPPEHVAWVDHGGGQALWDDLYRPFGLKPFMAGNTGFQMGGWFKSPVGSLDDLQAVKIRAAGLGAEVFRRLGMTAIVLSPGEIFTALQSGLVDAVEFLGPTSDVALGFQRVAPYYLWPSFNKPNGTGEAIVALSALEALDADLGAIFAGACALEASAGLAEADWDNGAAIAELAAGSDVTLAPWPEDVIAAARVASEEVRAEVGATDGRAAEVLLAYEAAIERLGGWSARSIGPYLAGRAPAA